MFSADNRTGTNTMTDIAKLRDAVVEAAMVLADGRRVEALGGESVRLDDHDRAYTRLDKAVSALRAAEEAARKPRLRNVDDWAAGWQREGRGGYARHYTGDTWIISTGLAVCLIEARDAEWMEAIRKLPRWATTDEGRSAKVWLNPAGRFIAHADIEALAATAST